MRCPRTTREEATVLSPPRNPPLVESGGGIKCRISQHLWICMQPGGGGDDQVSISHRRIHCWQTLQSFSIYAGHQCAAASAAEVSLATMQSTSRFWIVARVSDSLPVCANAGRWLPPNPTRHGQTTRHSTYRGGASRDAHLPRDMSPANVPKHNGFHRATLC